VGVAARGAEGASSLGNVYNPHLANHGAWAADPFDDRRVAGLAPVGSSRTAPAPLGLLDIGGNVAE